jgi:hypothetical protein
VRVLISLCSLGIIAAWMLSPAAPVAAGFASSAQWARGAARAWMILLGPFGAAAITSALGLSVTTTERWDMMGFPDKTFFNSDMGT